MKARFKGCVRAITAGMCLLTACAHGGLRAIDKPAPPPPAPLMPLAVAEAWRNNQPTPGPAGHLQMPVPRVQRLENGIATYCMAQATGAVALSLVVSRGAEDARPGKSGEAALTARLLVESTKHRGVMELAKAVEMLGSTLSSSAQRDFVAVSLETLPSDTERGVELLSEVLREPAWSPIDFARVRDQWLDDLQAERQSPASLAALVGVRALFGRQRGAPVTGSITDVKSLSIGDLKSWYKAFVVPRDVALVAVGPIDCEQVVAAARKTLADWRSAPADRTRVRYEALKQERNRIVLVDRKGAVQSALFVAQPFPRRLDPGHEARLALNDVIGGLFTSRINMNLREKHAYTYGARSTVIANRNFGLFAAQTSVRTDATAPALTELLAELAAAGSAHPRKPPSEDELNKARADLVYRLGAHLEQNRSLANDVENMFVQGLDPSYLSLVSKTYTAITLEDLMKQSPLITPEMMTIVIVGDRASIQKPLEQHGFSVVEPEPGWTD